MIGKGDGKIGSLVLLFLVDAMIRRHGSVESRRHARVVAVNSIFYSQCKVLFPEPDYLLAMKALAARVDGQDKADVIFLVRHLGIESAEDVLTIVTNYYPYQRIKPVTRYFIEELFDDYFTST